MGMYVKFAYIALVWRSENNRMCYHFVAYCTQKHNQNEDSECLLYTECFVYLAFLNIFVTFAVMRNRVMANRLI